ncbi:MAG: ribonuclease HII [Proteobacteria bacterium]|nr:ribonuclease HII [Pseudomonadota bacterium]MDA0861824.1 ribonuclease HII [Pseudomonadota bacterium]MDA1029930.1 ribonuclease HII [Pseudomonadota bacterium]
MNNIKTAAGVDEAGRGPLAGEVYAAAVILNPDDPIAGLRDSKKLSPNRRSDLSVEIKHRSLAWSISFASVEEIDKLNILNATLLAMERAIAGLKILPEIALVDGNKAPSLKGIEVFTIIRGDQKEPCISAASIIAKVARDERLMALDHIYPNWGFKRHKGYGTKIHIEAIKKYGITPLHRKSFEPIKSMKFN